MDALENLSILHIALLVFLRLLIVRKPLSTAGRPLRHRKALLLMIWLMSIIVEMPVPFLRRDPDFTALYRSIIFHVFSTLPVVLIVVFYIIMTFPIKSHKKQNEEALNEANTSMQRPKDSRTTLLISGMVAILLIGYLPYLVHRSIDFRFGLIYYRYIEVGVLLKV